MSGAAATSSSDARQSSAAAASSTAAPSSAEKPQSKDDVIITSYSGEHELPAIQALMDADLSEPYSIFTYRYFIHQWPNLCFLAWSKDPAAGDDVPPIDIPSAPEDEESEHIKFAREFNRVVTIKRPPFRVIHRPSKDKDEKSASSAAGGSSSNARGSKGESSKTTEHNGGGTVLHSVGSAAKESARAKEFGGADNAEASKKKEEKPFRVGENMYANFDKGPAYEGWTLADGDQSMPKPGPPGYICAGAVVAKLEPTKRSVSRGYIAMLAVAPTARKLGVGTRLVRATLHEMKVKGAEEVVLEAEVSNKGALKLYANLGFIRDKRLEKYYLSGADAFRLKLRLKSIPPPTFRLPVPPQAKPQGPDAPPYRTDLKFPEPE